MKEVQAYEGRFFNLLHLLDLVALFLVYGLCIAVCGVGCFIKLYTREPGLA